METEKIKKRLLDQFEEWFLINHLLNKVSIEEKENLKLCWVSEALAATKNLKKDFDEVDESLSK